jgi:hypothetical protein
VLPATTLEVEPTSAGLRLLTEQLTAFAHEHGLPEEVASRLATVASDVAEVVAASLDGRLQADVDIGVADTQLVVIARDHRLAEVYGSLRPRLDRLGSRCDGFAAELSSGSELQVWARFRLASA